MLLVPPLYHKSPPRGRSGGWGSGGRAIIKQILTYDVRQYGFNGSLETILTEATGPHLYNMWMLVYCIHLLIGWEINYIVLTVYRVMYYCHCVVVLQTPCINKDEHKLFFLTTPNSLKSHFYCKT